MSKKSSFFFGFCMAIGARGSGDWDEQEDPAKSLASFLRNAYFSSLHSLEALDACIGSWDGVKLILGIGGASLADSSVVEVARSIQT
jgi:hypothetical protein